MKRLMAIVFVSAVALGSALFLGASPAAADDLTPEQTAHIKSNCVAIKNSLNQLHVSDALLRVNRGQVYESMASKLMENFNARLASSRLDNKAMETVTASYRSELTAFRADYIAYEQKLSEAIRIDCVAQPNTFHAVLSEARQLRKNVHADVIKLHHLIDDYRSSVGGFLVNYERVSQ